MSYNAAFSTAAAILAAAAMSACVASGGESLVILYNVAPEDGCIVSGSATNFVARGTIDTHADQGYLFTPLVQNLTQGVEGGASRLAIIEGANIDLEFVGDKYSDADIAALAERNLISFSQYVSGSIQPDGGQTGFGFEVIPGAVLDDIAGKLAPGESLTVIAATSMYGKIGGGGIESNTFRYPIDVCNGCLLVNVGDCSALPDGFSARTGGACQALQDGVLDCCDLDGTAICPAQPAGGTQ